MCSLLCQARIYVWGGLLVRDFGKFECYYRTASRNPIGTSEDSIPRATACRYVDGTTVI